MPRKRGGETVETISKLRYVHLTIDDYTNDLLERAIAGTPYSPSDLIRKLLSQHLGIPYKTTKQIRLDRDVEFIHKMAEQTKNPIKVGQVDGNVDIEQALQDAQKAADERRKQLRLKNG